MFEKEQKRETLCGTQDSFFLQIVRCLVSPKDLTGSLKAKDHFLKHTVQRSLQHNVVYSSTILATGRRTGTRNTLPGRLTRCRLQVGCVTYCIVATGLARVFFIVVGLLVPRFCSHALTGSMTAKVGTVSEAKYIILPYP